MVKNCKIHLDFILAQKNEQNKDFNGVLSVAVKIQLHFNQV